MTPIVETSTHPMPYRILWTWDSWLCDPFSADSYVTEFKKLIDFSAEWGYNGIIIWGFIDSRHGGEESAKEIASYGKSKGVRILPGIGAGGYCGFDLTPGHKFNMETFLKERPDLRAYPRDFASQPHDGYLCLYQEDGLKWIREGAKWLAENFEIGGVNIETNEMGGIDVCEHAKAATEAEPNRLKYAASFSDLALVTPIIHEEVRKIHPDSWTTYATYEPSWWRRQEDAHLLADMPKEAIAQWNMELDVNEEGIEPPVEQNVSLVHSGGWSYHLYSFPPIWGFTQYRCFYPNLEEARAFCINQYQIGTQGMVLGNVGSAEMPDNEIDYIAYIEFSRNPELTVDEFSKKHISKLYGEEAEPLVKQLMLAQPEVQNSVKQLYKTWALMMFDMNKYPLPKAEDSQIEALKGQINLAQKAHDAANESGKKRLEIIIQILKEYVTIAELSRDPRLECFHGEMTDDERKEAYKVLVDLASAAGLSDDVYRYSRLLD